MKRWVIVLGLGVLLTGCASKPLTPEQAWRYQQAGDAVSGLGQQLQQQNRSEQCYLRDTYNGAVVWCP